MRHLRKEALASTVTRPKRKTVMGKAERGTERLGELNPLVSPGLNQSTQVLDMLANEGMDTRDSMFL